MSEHDFLKTKTPTTALIDAEIQTLGVEHIITESEVKKSNNMVIASHLDIVLNRGLSQTPTPTPNQQPKTNQPTERASQTMDEQDKKSSSNPFLPDHVVQALRRGNESLVQEIAQSSEALNASAALMRSYQKNSPSRLRFEERDEGVNQRRAERYKLVDELVQEYLPLIAADLRRKLRSQIDQELHHPA